LLRWADGDEERALAAYNGGKGGNSVRPFRNAAYAAKVLARRA
jgi:soluble lytic murein transglycosylase-like protein